jgi:SAM-dependent methyltransferase
MPAVNCVAEPRISPDRPPDVRRVKPWHRLAYITRVWPRRLEEVCRSVQLPPRARILDYGCADVPYRGFFPTDADFVPADLAGNPHAALTINPDGTVPVEPGTFDAVLSTQVLEHVSDPGAYLAECHRVLRPGGTLILSTHGIFVYHPDPVDYWRWTSAGLRRTVEAAGFEVDRFDGFLGMAGTGVQLVQDSLINRLPRWLHPVVALIMQGLIALAETVQTREGSAVDAMCFIVVARRRQADSISS